MVGADWTKRARIRRGEGDYRKPGGGAVESTLNSVEPASLPRSCDLQVMSRFGLVF